MDDTLSMRPHIRRRQHPDQRALTLASTTRIFKLKQKMPNSVSGMSKK
ncbi:MAG: hypothetical protein R2911_09320 [Caldilineaceae bacterium]